jgi:putative ABC transport system permease protein
MKNMNFYILLKQWFSSIFANKLRSILSILWIVIGISSVVIMLAVWEWAKQSILSSFDNIDNLVTIEKKYDYWPAPDTKNPWSTTTYNTAKEVITKDIADILKEKVYGIQSVIYASIVNVWDIKYNSKPIYWTVKWISFDYLQTKDYKIKDGSYFSRENYENDDKVVILWYSLVYDSFWKENPIWKKITLGWWTFIVKWILEKNNWNTDYNVFIPVTTAMNRLWSKELEKIEVFTDKKLDINPIKKDLQYYLLSKSWTSNPSDVKFTVRTNEDALKQVNEIVWKMRLLLGAIGSIALVVWWIWIMNIMLVSVTERTREIWIRKAIWASNSNILFQFLIESIILSMIWCLIAVWACYWIAYGVAKILPDFKPIITVSVLVISSLVSIWMGIIFWIMPAWKAARLKPIDALRFE